MNENKQLTFMDVLSIISFAITLKNLNLNLAQEDLDNQTQELDKKLKSVVDNIHFHLQEQDEKINKILKELEQ